MSGSLKERLQGNVKRPVFSSGAGGAATGGDGGRHVNRDDYQSLKSHIHRNLISRLDLTRLDKIQPAVLKDEITRIAEDMILQEGIPLSVVERERLVGEVRDELFGLGPLEPLLNDPTISDILVNGHKQVFVERRGKLEKTDVIFKDDEHLLQIIDRIVSRVGRRIDESSPMVDARLPDGSRVNAIIPPLAIDGPALSIRRFGTIKIAMDELIRYGTLTPGIAFVLEGCVRARLNILISGGTGAGKTTLLNVLSSYIPSDERIITIEDSAELQLQQEHVVRLETRPPNIEGRGEVSARDLVRNCLRMRPDRIVVGECRSDEAIDMLQAMNTGHDGSLTTIHANSPRDALARLETMISMGGLNLSDKAMRQQIASAIHLIVQAGRLSDGSRKVTHVTEITGMEGETVTMQDIFVFERTGVDANGRVMGTHKPTGIRPKFAERLRRYGYNLNSSIFEPR
ncbi:MAG: CpaF family protein [Acidobacteriota bacterium]|nr:CpaF family protein [Blastocatellia bacterium]MDW8240873.1 CpaF family protein [Acidobacteriota bacterium]